MKKIFFVLAIGAVCFACNSSDESAKVPEKAADTVAAAVPMIVDEKGLELIGASDCTTCHAIDKKLIGPAYLDVSKKYEPTEEVIKMLIGKVKAGGSGVWGAIPMTPHPDLKDEDIREMIKYILSLKNQ